MEMKTLCGVVTRVVGLCRFIVRMALWLKVKLMLKLMLKL